MLYERAGTDGRRIKPSPERGSHLWWVVKDIPRSACADPPDQNMYEYRLRLTPRVAGDGRRKVWNFYSVFKAFNVEPLTQQPLLSLSCHHELAA